MGDGNVNDGQVYPSVQRGRHAVSRCGTAGKYLQATTRAAFLSFPSDVFLKQGEWCRRVVIVMLRAGTPNCILSLQQDTPKKKMLEKNIYITNIIYI
jgi:hypothetical protein